MVSSDRRCRLPAFRCGQPHRTTHAGAEHLGLIEDTPVCPATVVKRQTLNVKTPPKIKLGGAFRPQKKTFTPPPPNSLQTPSRPLAPPGPSPPPPPGRPPAPPPPGIFNEKPTPAPSWRLGLPLPFPRSDKIKNIRNVYQVKYGKTENSSKIGFWKSGQ